MEQKRGEGKQKIKKGGQARSRGGCPKNVGGLEPPCKLWLHVKHSAYAIAQKATKWSLDKFLKAVWSLDKFLKAVWSLDKFLKAVYPMFKMSLAH